MGTRGHSDRAEGRAIDAVATLFQLDPCFYAKPDQSRRVRGLGGGVRQDQSQVSLSDLGGPADALAVTDQQIPEAGFTAVGTHTKGQFRVAGASLLHLGRLDRQIVLAGLLKVLEPTTVQFILGGDFVLELGAVDNGPEIERHGNAP